jgi:putative DNA primase/helicase
MTAQADPIREFSETLALHGLVPGEILPDGALHRFSSSKDKAGDLAGWYVLHHNGNGCYGASFGDWRTGIEETWFSTGAKNLDREARTKLLKRLNQAKSTQEENRTTAKEKAAQLWEKARPVQDKGHAYLKAKGVQSYGLKAFGQGKTALVIPARDQGGTLLTLQFIQEDGSKRFMKGGRVSGASFGIKGGMDTIYVCEGYATGASIHEATGQTVVCAFNAGNLKAVARKVRQKHPEGIIVVAGDNDQWTQGNPGKTKGIDAAKAIKARFVVPTFKDAKTKPTDFNDLATLEGLQVVKTQLELKSENQKSKEEYFPFERKKSGVYYWQEERDGSLTPIKISSPIDVEAFTHNEHQEQWGRLICVTDRKGMKHRFAVPMGTIQSNKDDLFDEICSIGFEPIPGKKNKNLVREFLIGSNPGKTVLCVDRIGWYGETFVLPETTFCAEKEESVVFQGLARDHNFKTRGTLAAWGREIGLYCQGNSRLILAASLGFAAPLLHLAGGESGGFHIFGDSSVGKSTILQVAGSICGGGPNGFHRQWRTTDNALEAIAAAHSDTLLCLDEIGQCEGKVVSDISYMLANGQGKQRMSKGASLKRAFTWRILFLSTGELSSLVKIQEDGRRIKPGQEVRILDIPACPKNGSGIFEETHGMTGADLADHFKRAIQEVYGAPLHAFLKTIVHQVPFIRQEARQAIRHFLAQNCPKGSPQAVRRACSRFGLVAYAGDLAARLNIAPWERDQGTWAAGVCFRAWLNQRGGAVDLDVAKGLEQVREFIQAHGASRFEILGKEIDQRIVNRAGYKRKNDLGDYDFLVFPETFKKEVCAGISYKKVCRALQRCNALIANESHLTKAEWIQGQGTPGRFFVVRQRELEKGGGDDD